MQTRVARASVKRPVKPKFVDPFKPLSDQEVRTRASSLVNQQLSPLMAQLREVIEGRSRAGQQAIGGYTQRLQGNLADLLPKLQHAYAGAQQSQAATNDALAQRLGGHGQQLSQELGGKLAEINAPAAAHERVAEGAAQTGTGAANAGYAAGSAELSRLLAEGAHATEYGSKLPGIAGLGGLQHSRDLEAMLSRELAEKGGEITGQGGALFAQLYQHLTDQELNKAIAKGSGLSQQAELKYKREQAAYERQLKQQQLTETRRHHQANEGTAAMRAAIAAANAAERARTNKVKERRKPNASLSAKYGWIVDDYGNYIRRKNKRTGKMERIPVVKSKSYSGGINSSTGLPNRP
jgi:hypothetical protein